MNTNYTRDSAILDMLVELKVKNDSQAKRIASDREDMELIDKRFSSAQNAMFELKHALGQIKATCENALNEGCVLETEDIKEMLELIKGV